MKATKKTKVMGHANDDLIVTSPKSESTLHPFLDGNKIGRTFLNNMKASGRLFSVILDSFSAETRMKVKRNIIPDAAGKKIIDALGTIRKELTDGSAKIDGNHSNIYSYIHARLSEILGETADYARIAYSQEDHNTGDLRAWVRNALDSLDSALQGLQEVLIGKAEENVKAVMPSSFATPNPLTTLGLIIAGYVEMLGHDRSRIQDWKKRHNSSPFGLMNLSGSMFPINREMTSRILGFESVAITNSKDDVAEFASLAALMAMQLGNLASEMLTWQSPALGYIEFSNDFITQNHLMDSKRDPESLELIRAKTSRIYGSLMSTLSLIKGLSIGSSRDIQELSEIAFDIYDTLHSSLNMMTALVSNFIVNRKNIKESIQMHYPTTPDIMNWLIMELGMPVRQAENVTKGIIEMAITKGKKLSLLDLSELRTLDSRITKEIYSVLIPSRSIVSKRSSGGPGPVQLKKALRHMRRRYL